MHTKNQKSAGYCPGFFTMLPIPLGSSCFYKHEWSSALEDTYSLDRITSEELAILGTTEDQPSSSCTGVLVLEF